MKRVFPFLALCIGTLPLQAAIEILYLEPSDTAPVLGSISTGSEAFREAKPVGGKEGWLEVIRRDYYSGFIARDSLDSDGKVEIGTALLQTPSKKGQVLTTIEANDEVTVNLVDDWTEITVNKEIPGYFKPIDPDAAEKARQNAPPPPASLNYAEDPLLEQARATRYTPPPVAAATVTTSDPVPARGITLSEEPLTGFEEADSLNPAFGATAPDGTNRGYSLGAGSTPIPAATAADRNSTFRSGSMQDPTSIARIPAENPSEFAPTQSEEVTTLQVEQETGPSIEDRMAELEKRMAGEDQPTPSETAIEDFNDSAEIQEAAVAVAEEPLEVPESSEPEVIPLAPPPAEVPEAVPPPPVEVEEPIEEAPVEIIESTDEVEVTEEVAEAVVPGITPTIIEEEPALTPPTDTNRTYIGRLQRTKPGFWGKEPPERFEVVNYHGDRIAYVNLDSVITSSEEKFVDRIVRVYGVLTSEEDSKALTIKAANITLR